MDRIPFSQVLKNASIDLRREYDRLYGMFCVQKLQDGSGANYTLKEFCAANFINLHFRGTCVSLDDFDDYYGYHFEKVPSDFDIDYLVSFCEYSYNLAIYNQGYGYGMQVLGSVQPMQFYVQQVMRVIESIGYMSNTQNGVFDFVPKDQAAISVAEIVDPSLSYKVIEYNHHSMKGDLERKKAVLLALADQLEPQREKLKQINSSLESDLFFLFNNINLRHNNSDSGGKNYILFIAKRKDSEIEHWYDDTYQMCLLAFLELDHLNRKDWIKGLKESIQKKIDM
ncbi:MAG: hypothetical protein IJR89_02080 [Clostridia bacterium]|nr:hypothetical protein [Clostridia bacterium]